MPLDLLSYYTPYFDAYFNGAFDENIETVLRLPDDNPAFWNIFFKYLQRGSAKYRVQPPQDNKDLGEVLSMWRTIMKFIEFCENYIIGELSSAVAGTLMFCLDLDQLVLSECEDDFSFIFHHLPEDNPTHRATARYLAKTLCSEDRADRLPVEEFLKKNKEVAGHVMKAFIEITRLGIDIYDGREFRGRFLRDGGMESYM